MSAPAHILDYVRSLTQDPFPNPDYHVCNAVTAEAYLYSAPIHHFSAVPILACDTESLPDGTPYCITFSHTPGTGRLIYLPAAGSKYNPRAFETFVDYINFFGLDAHLLFHNYLHDGPVFEQLGLDIDRSTDTMVREY